MIRNRRVDNGRSNITSKLCVFVLEVCDLLDGFIDGNLMTNGMNLSGNCLQVKNDFIELGNQSSSLF